MNNSDAMPREPLTPFSLFYAMRNVEALSSNYLDMGGGMLDFLETVGNFNRDNALAFTVLVEPTGEDLFSLVIGGADTDRPLTRQQALAIIGAFAQHFPDDIVRSELSEHLKEYYIYAPATPHNTCRREK